MRLHPDDIKLKDLVVADGVVCEVVSIDTDDDGTFYSCDPINATIHGFVRSFTKDQLKRLS